MESWKVEVWLLCSNSTHLTACFVILFLTLVKKNQGGIQARKEPANCCFVADTWPYEHLILSRAFGTAQHHDWKLVKDGTGFFAFPSNCFPQSRQY